MRTAPTVAAAWNPTAKASVAASSSRAGRSAAAPTAPPRRVAGGLGGAGVDPGGRGVLHPAAVDRGADAAEHRDAERAAELGAGLGEPEATPARSGGAAAMTRSVPSVTAGAAPSASSTDPATTAARPDSPSTRVISARPATASAAAPATTSRRRRGARGAGEHRAHDEAGGRGQRPEPRLQRRVAQHQLQVLGDEETRCRTPRRAPRCSSPRATLKAGTRNRRRSTSGSSRRRWRREEQRADGQAGRDRDDRRAPAEPSCGDPLDPVDHPQHGRPATCAALTRSSRPASGSRYSGSSRGPTDEQQRHHRDGEQEDRAPPEVLQQEPAGERADRRPGGEAGDPDRDRERALPVVLEHVADQGERRRRQRRAGDAQQRPRARSASPRWSRRPPARRRRRRPRRRSAAACGARRGRRASPS